MPAENVVNRIIDAMGDDTSGLDAQFAALLTVEDVELELDTPTKYWRAFPLAAHVNWPFVSVVITESTINFYDVNGFEDHDHFLTVGYYFAGNDEEQLQRKAMRACRAIEGVLTTNGLVESYSDDDVSILQVTPQSMQYSVEPNRVAGAPAQLMGGGEFTVTVRERCSMFT